VLFESYYVDDTAFILLSRGEGHFRRFGLTIHSGRLEKKTEAIYFPRPVDMEDIEIDEDRFVSSLLLSKPTVLWKLY
jgi:hypothetical protein